MGRLPWAAGVDLIQEKLMIVCCRHLHILSLWRAVLSRSHDGGSGGCCSDDDTVVVFD